MIWYGRNDGTENGIGTNLTIQTQLRKKKKKKRGTRKGTKKLEKGGKSYTESEYKACEAKKKRKGN